MKPKRPIQINQIYQSLNSFKGQQVPVNHFDLMKQRIQSLIMNSFAIKGYITENKIPNILGCTYQEFKEHIEKQFLPWMSWDNYGLYNGDLNCGWDFDHIIPKSSAKTNEDIINLNHYTNFQPLCSYVNRYIKKNVIE